MALFAPNFFKAFKAATAGATVFVADRIFFVVILVILFGLIKARRWQKLGLNIFFLDSKPGDVLDGL
jgi:hypothetical protein